MYASLEMPWHYTYYRHGHGPLRSEDFPTQRDALRACGFQMAAGEISEDCLFVDGSDVLIDQGLSGAAHSAYDEWKAVGFRS
jgi:hypothetical protein